MDIRVSISKLENYCNMVFCAGGLSMHNARSTTESLIHADLRGVYSHGVCRVLEYAKRLKYASACAVDESRIVSETSCTAVIDGGHVLGAVVAEKAVALARQKAEEKGISFVTVRNSNHYGMAAHWAIKLAGDDMIGFTASDTDPCLAPLGGTRAYIGNNPFAYATSGETYQEICLDIACSMVAGGKKRRMIERGEIMPDNWFLTAEGKATTDPKLGVVALPFGGHKGSGLSFMMEVLTSALGGGVFGDAMPGFLHLDAKNPTSHCFMAVNVSAFRSLGAFKRHVDTYIDYIKSCPKAEGVGEILYPGEVEWRCKFRNLREGVPLSEEVAQDLIKAGDLVGLSAEEYHFLVEEIKIQK